MIVSVVGPGEKVLAPITVTSRLVRSEAAERGVKFESSSKGVNEKGCKSWVITLD